MTICNIFFDPYGKPIEQTGILFLLTLTMDTSALLLNIASAIAMVTIKEGRIKFIYKEILLSMSLGNVLGSSGFIIDTLTNFCEDHSSLTTIAGKHRYCSILLMLTHLCCLISADYSVRRPRSQPKKKRITGLLVLSWVMSICIGGLVESEYSQHFGRQSIAVINLFFLVSMVLFYLTVMRNLKQKILKVQRIRDTFFGDDDKRYSRDPRRRISKFPRLIIGSFLLLSVPWCFVEMVKEPGAHMLFHRLAKIVYSIQFHIVGFICLNFRLRFVTDQRPGRNLVSMKNISVHESLKYHSKKNYGIALGFFEQVEMPKGRKIRLGSNPYVSSTPRMSTMFFKPLDFR